MSVIKHSIDVLEIAVRIERKGIEFYRNLYEKTESPHARSVFSFLAAEEEKHAGTFGKMLEELADYVPRYEYPGEYGLFLSDVAAGILRTLERIGNAAPAATVNESIDLGIEFEKETILYYTELKLDTELGSKYEEMLKKLIDEERAHWRKLSQLKTEGKLEVSQ